ncbi:unnamed protein product, partial [Brenthis ino]
MASPNSLRDPYASYINGLNKNYPLYIRRGNYCCIAISVEEPSGPLCPMEQQIKVTLRGRARSSFLPPFTLTLFERWKTS